MFDKVSYNARYMKIRGVKNASFPGFGPFRLQRPVFASSVCLVCICVLLCFTPVSCVYFYLVLFSVAAVRVCFLFLYCSKIKKRSIGLQWLSVGTLFVYLIQGLNTCILTLMLQSFTTYYGHMIAGFEFAALETAYFSSRPGKPANMVFVGVGPWVQSFSGLSSIPETSTRKPSCAAPSKASIGPESISAESSSGGKVFLFSPVFASVVSNAFFFGSTLPSGFCSMAART